MSFVIDNSGLGSVRLVTGGSGNWTFTFPTSAGTNGQYLQTNGSGVLSWASSTSTLEGLTDVTITTPVDNQALVYSSGAWINKTLTPSDVGAQAADATLTALAAYNTNGFIVQTAADTFAGRSIAGTADIISVTNGDGVAGNPTINLADVSQAATGDFVKVTVDTKGRVSGNTAVVASDITDLLDAGAGTYLPIGGGTLTGALTLAADPVSALQAVTKQYVDGLVSGIHIKGSVIAATTADITLSGEQTIDGIAIVDGDRVLVKNQTAPEENGIYVAATGAWARSSDMDTWDEVPAAFVFVQQGSTQADTGWVVTSDAGGTIGTTPIVWTQFSGAGSIVPGNGLDLTGNTLSVVSVDADRITVGGSGIDLATTGVSANTYNNVTVDTYGRVTAGSNVAYLTANQTITLSGDITGSGTTSIAGTLATVNVAPVTAALAVITVNGKGLVTASTAAGAADIEGALGYTPVADTTQVIAGTGLTGGGALSGDVTIDLDDTAVTAASYGSATEVATFTVDAQGRLTAASDVAIAFPVTSVNSQTGAVVLDKDDIGLTNVVNSLQVINGGGAPQIREDVFANRGAATLEGEIFIATDTQAIYAVVGGNWISFANGSATGTVTSVDITPPAAGITATGGPVTTAGSITLALADDLAAVEGLSGTGIAVRTAANTWTNRSVAGTAGDITVTNGDGVAGNPTFALDTVTQASSGDFVKVTLDTKGRVTGNTAVLAADITGLIDGTYLELAGGTMAGSIVIPTGEVITITDAPVDGTDAANKAYVDAVAAGLSWKQAVVAGTTGNITLSGEQTIDGVAVVTGNRVLVKDQTDATENGIYVAAVGAWARAADFDSLAPIDEINGAAVFVIQGTANAGSGWVVVSDVVTIGTSDIDWTQFNGAGLTAGVGLEQVGNALNVRLGAGIGQLPSNEVGIELFAPTTGAIILTEDGTTRSTDTAAELHLLLDGSTLTQGASGLRVADNVALPGTGAVTVPVGTDAQQPAGAIGQIRYNSTNNEFEGYVNSAWTTFVTEDNVSVPLSSLTNATAANTLTNGANAQTWQWQLTADSTTALTLSESAASTNGTAGNQTILHIATTTASTAGPIKVERDGEVAFGIDSEGTITLNSDPDSSGISINSETPSVSDPFAIVHGQRAAAGAAYTVQHVLRAETTNATPTNMLDGAGALLTVPVSATWKFEVHVVGRRTDADGESAGWKFEGVIDRGATGGAALVGGVMQTIIARDSASWDVAVSASGNDLVIAVTGEAAKDINWVAFVRTVVA